MFRRQSQRNTPTLGAINEFQFTVRVKIKLPHPTIRELITYLPGTIIHIKKYITKPGTPPGIRAIRNANRNQNALIPKNCDNPPHTPAITRLLRDRRSLARTSDIIYLLNNNFLTSLSGCTNNHTCIMYRFHFYLRKSPK